jgi:hypothetical protein
MRSFPVPGPYCRRALGLHVSPPCQVQARRIWSLEAIGTVSPRRVLLEAVPLQCKMSSTTVTPHANRDELLGPPQSANV